MPRLGAEFVQSFKEQPGGITKINKAVSQVNGQRIESDDPEEKGPFLVIPHIDHQIKESQGQEAHSPGQQDERTGP